MKRRIWVSSRVVAALALAGLMGTAARAQEDEPSAPGPAAATGPAYPIVLYTKDKAPPTPKVEDLPLKDSVSQYGITWTFDKPAEPTIAVAERIKIPMLILHGSRDGSVPPEHSALLKQILDRNRVPNERHVIDGAGHGIANRPEVYRWIREWFTKYDGS